MKKVLTVLLAFGLGVGVRSLLDEKAPVAEAGQEPACAQLLETAGGVIIQDMNGDGALDPIAEALRLLSWAFLGGPAPVRPCAPSGPSGLPDTGQTKCYDQSGAEIPCDSATCPGQDGAYATGCPAGGRFTNNGDGTVTDTCTSLMWQQDIVQGGDSWCNALSYCENLSLAGHDDWRMPNLRELQSLVDNGRQGPAIDPVFGFSSGGIGMWSSTSNALGPAQAWVIDFCVGDVFGGGKDGGLSVRAVRSGL